MIIGIPRAFLYYRYGRLWESFFDRLDPEQCRAHSKQLSQSLYWIINKEIMGAIELCKDKDDGVVLLTAFPCGTDSLTNEITAHAVGTLSRHPNANTILEIGGQDSKIIILRDGIVVDYAMNTLCAAGTGAFLSSQAKRLGIVGHKKEDLVAGLCHAVVSNYLANVGKGKSIKPPIVFQGGVSKNKGVVRAFQEELGYPVYVDEDSHLMGAIGAAVLSRPFLREKPFDTRLARLDYTASASECGGCSNHCEIVRFYRQGELLDSWGNRCDSMGEKKNA